MTLRCITLALLILYALITIYSIIGSALGIASFGFITPLVTSTGFALAFSMPDSAKAGGVPCAC